MKNLNKTVAAGVLGVALLAGTAGTFATWENSDSVPAGTITTGDLSIELRPLGHWAVERQNANGAWVDTNIRTTDLSSVELFPGSRVRTPLTGNIDVRGLTLQDVTITSARWGDLQFDNQNFLILKDKDGNEHRTQLQFAMSSQFIDVNENTNWLVQRGDNYATTLSITFVRDTVNNFMYDYDLSEDLGELTVVVTQN